MRKSLIDSIGQRTALKLMEGAVLQAIEESHQPGLDDNANAAQAVGGVLCRTESGRKMPPIAGGIEQLGSRTFSKKVSIA